MSNFADSGRDPADRLAELATAAWGCGRELRRLIADRLAADGVDDEAFLALAILDKAAGGVVQGELAESLAVSPAQTSGLVERLRKQGWCESRRDANDRRRQRWVLTEAGRVILGRCSQALHAVAVSLLVNVEPSEIARVLELLTRISASVPAVASTGRAVA